MIAMGGGMTVSHPLPAEGIDLRAELAEHQRSRIAQALVRAEGDSTAAAKLLRLTPLELVRMQAGHIAVAATRQGVQTQSKRTLVGLGVERGDIPRIERGVEMISVAVIKRLRAEGLEPEQIARRLGCNHFVVEKVLRIETERAVRRLRAEGLEPIEISRRLGVTQAVVDRALGAPELAKCAPRRTEEQKA